MANQTILVIDNDEGIRDIFQILLEAEGYTVRSLKRLPDIAMVTPLEPNLIILDIFLNGEDGIEGCFIFKNHLSTRHIPILISSVDAKGQERSKICGDAFLPRPFAPEQLLQQVKFLLSLNRHNIVTHNV